MTLQAIKVFQTSRDIVASGYVGPITRKAINDINDINDILTHP